MKKIILSLFILLIGCKGICSNCEFTCVDPYDLSSSASQFFSTITGNKYITQKAGASILKKSIKSNIAKGDIKVNLESFSAKDLKAGRFKTIEVTGKDINIQGIHIDSFTAKTLCNFNYITQDTNGNLIIKEDLPFVISAVLTEENINNTMRSSEYKRLVDNINELGGNFNIFHIDSTNVKIRNNKLYYIMKYSMPFMRKSKEIVISADLKVVEGEIKLANTTFENNSVSLDIDKFSKILNYINPLDFSAKILENKDAKFGIQNIVISDNQIVVVGIMTILKDKE